jgi:RNA polymerase sigma-70 factor (ECF subfamily)
LNQPHQISPEINIREESAFENLFRLHYASLVSFAVKYVIDSDIAEELVQDVFMNIWTKSENIQIQTTVKSYLFGAVRNASLNHLKHQKVRQAYADKQMLNISQPEHTDFLELDELKSMIDDALNKIPKKCREIFELNRFDGKRYKEIAADLNLSLKTVENQMGKALKILRDELGDYLPIVFLFIFLYGGKI